MNLPPGADGFPPCSLNCLSSNLDSAPEVIQNFKLLCANVSLEKSIAACVRGVCNFADQQRVIGQNADLCKDQPVQNRIVFGTVVLAILGTITQVTIGLRLYTRRKLASALGIGMDDYLILGASVVIGYVMISGTVEVIGFGFGKHTFNVNPAFLLPNSLLYWLDEIIYQIAMTLVKCSILCFYLRLFPDQRFRYACYGMLVFVIMTGLTFMFVTIFQCKPIRGVFDKSIEAPCLDNNTATFASSGFSMTIDFTILLMPIRPLLKLRVPRAQRNSVLVIFSFGLLASIVSVIRLPFIIPFGKTTDPFYDNIGPGIWTFTEMATAVIAACLPALKPLVVKFFPKLFPESTSRNALSPQVHEPARISPHNPGPLSRDFNSLFSRAETRRDRSHSQSKYFSIEDGKIVQLKTRFSALSMGLSEAGNWEHRFDKENKLETGDRHGDLQRA